MSTFHELYVKGTVSELDKFKKAVFGFNENGWAFRTEKFNGWDYFFFRKIDLDVEISLLYKEGEDVFYVPNVVPIRRDQISPQEYNEYLAVFKQEVLEVVIGGKADINVQITIEGD